MTENIKSGETGVIESETPPQAVPLPSDLPTVPSVASGLWTNFLNERLQKVGTPHPFSSRY
jgi:hypothetical protein